MFSLTCSSIFVFHFSFPLYGTKKMKRTVLRRASRRKIILLTIIGTHEKEKPRRNRKRHTIVRTSFVINVIVYAYRKCILCVCMCVCKCMCKCMCTLCECICVCMYELMRVRVSYVYVYVCFIEVETVSYTPTIITITIIIISRKIMS